ncbi:hypothetical protein PsYK624_156920 [Phanerochaete sordida]|uniref:DUF6534 domain-containing protein n=1 Tax=Phanerochaete sordida TaxID=48140 RepID=A0A9P3LLI6_9APHY|nr:hypothetical protein PsYK624_156920 [Phanerochaete sordida]
MPSPIALQVSKAAPGTDGICIFACERRPRGLLHANADACGCDRFHLFGGQPGRIARRSIRLRPAYKPRLDEATLPPLPWPTMQFGSTLGATLISGAIVAILYGTLNVQCYSFYHHYGLQSKFLISIVCLLWILCTLHLVFTEINMYFIFVSNFGNVDVSKSFWPVSASDAVTVITALVVQCWYCNRVWILSNENKTLTYIPISMIIVSFGFGAATCAEIISKHGSIDEFHAIEWVPLVTVASMSAADVYIAMALCYLLYKHRKHVLPRTSSVLNTVMIYTVSTGLLTSAVSVSFIVALLALSGTWVWVGEYTLFCGLYCNSLLAWINARDYLRERLDLTLNTSAARPGVPLSSVRFAGAGPHTFDTSETAYSSNNQSISCSGSEGQRDGWKSMAEIVLSV